MTRRKRRRESPSLNQSGIFIGSKDVTVGGGEYVCANGDASMTKHIQVNLLVINLNGSPHLTVTASMAATVGLFGYPVHNSCRG